MTNFLDTGTPLLASYKNTIRYENGKVVLLNRRLYPEQLQYVTCENFEEVAIAIENMTIQGATVLGMTAGYGFVLALEHSGLKGVDSLEKFASQVYKRFLQTRPTGQRLKVILDKCFSEVMQGLKNGATTGEELAKLVHKLMDHEMDRAGSITEQCGKNAADLLKDGDKVLTHCFADSALIHMLLAARKSNKHIEMYCTETRPYLQGARLTAHSISETGTKVTLVTDNMPGFLMQQGIITKFVTAADKITMDGYVCNKVGTYQYAVVSQYHNIPYIVLGNQGPDINSPTKNDIEIEYRNPEEVFYFRGVRTAVEGIEGLYPSFDIVSPNFVDAIVTDRGTYTARNISDYHKKDKS